MTVTRYVGGKEVSRADLQNIVITDNKRIKEAIDRIVNRINQDAENNNITTSDISA